MIFFSFKLEDPDLNNNSLEENQDQGDWIDFDKLMDKMGEIYPMIQQSQPQAVNAQLSPETNQINANAQSSIIVNSDPVFGEHFAKEIASTIQSKLNSLAKTNQLGYFFIFKFSQMVYKVWLLF